VPIARNEVYTIDFNTKGKVVQSRQRKEKEFHNEAYSEHTRESAAKFYSVASSSKAFYEHFLESHCSQRNVLEYGCGPGSYSLYLARRGAADVTGIDISDVGIEQAREKARRQQIARVTYHVMDAEAMDLPNDTFDLICGTGILHHLDLAKYSFIAS